jgi:hypothetical protein
MTLRISRVILLGCCLASFGSWSQLVEKYDLWQIEENELYWSNSYPYRGSLDSLQQEVEKMLRSKSFTFQMVRNENGYYGEIRHYRVDCRRYGRSHLNTPSMYWSGEWTGKFTVDVHENSYRVIVYALYYEKAEPTEWYHKKARTSRGKYVDAVTTRRKRHFKKHEFSNLALMSLSLKDSFDLTRASFRSPD